MTQADPNQTSREEDEGREPGAATPQDARAPEEEAPRDEAPRDEALARAEGQAQAEREKALRAQAELENYRRRAAREMENARRFALERFMQDLLDVRDSLERGLEVGEGEQATVAQLLEGTALTFRMLDKVLTTHGLTEIDPVGEPFDPDRHEAMSMVPSEEHAPDTVVTVVQKGYLLNDRLLRPARVLVARGNA